MPPENPRPGVRVSLRDVAKAIGVSHVTVSLALRGDTRVSAARRREVEEAAARLGYRPDPMLSSLSAYRQSKHPVNITSTVAWLNQWENPNDLRSYREFAAYQRGATETAEHLGYRLEEFAIARNFPPQRLHQILTTRNIRGILIPPHTYSLELPEFAWSDFSLVRFGVSVSEPRAHIVTSDQSNCASMAFTHARERGYRRIGYVTAGRLDRNTGGNFRAGYLSAQDALAPLADHLEPLILRGKSADEDTASFRAWWKQFRPDAIVSTESQLAAFLEHVGACVPRDLGVAALSVLDGNFDSGVDQNSFEIGAVAMRTLAGLIHQNERGVPQYCRRILVEGRWIDGNSLPVKAPARATGQSGPRVRTAKKTSGRSSTKATARAPRGGAAAAAAEDFVSGFTALG